MMEPPFEGRYRVNPTSAMRRPRAGFASLPPGGPGQPSVPTTRDRPSVGWTRRGRRRAKACRIGGPRGPRPRPEARPRGQKTPPWRAERRPRSPKGNAARRKDWCAARCAIPSRFEGARLGPAKAGRKTAYPAPLKNTGDACCLGANRASPARAALACRAEAEPRRAV